MNELTLSLVLQETVNLGGGTVVGANGEAVVGNVQNQVLAHDGQTDEAEISTRNNMRRSADIDAGETGAIVSDRCLVNSWVNNVEGQFSLGNPSNSEIRKVGMAKSPWYHLALTSAESPKALNRAARCPSNIEICALLLLQGAGVTSCNHRDVREGGVEEEQ